MTHRVGAPVNVYWLRLTKSPFGLDLRLGGGILGVLKGMGRCNPYKMGSGFTEGKYLGEKAYDWGRFS